MRRVWVSLVVCFVGCQASVRVREEDPVTSVYALGEVSRDLYADERGPSRLRAGFGGAGRVHFELPRSKVEVAYLVDVGRKLQVIGVRGTDNLRNLVVNADVAQEWDDTLRCHLHAGFQQAAREVLARLKPRLRTEEGWATLLTGHSLGGAVATIAGLYLNEEGYVVEGVVTFGAPKITDAWGAEVCADRIPVLRVIHGQDPVPAMPPPDLEEVMDADYHHFGARLWVHDGVLDWESEPEAPPSESLARAMWEGDRALLTEAEDHKISAYLEGLWSHVPEVARLASLAE